MLIHGLPKYRNENTDQIVIETLKEKMGEKYKEVHLDRTQRLGAPQDDKVRPIIVKFARYNTRSRVFKNKNKLKGKKGQHNRKLNKDANNVWTYDTKIMYKDVNDNKIKTCYD